MSQMLHCGILTVVIFLRCFVVFNVLSLTWSLIIYIVSSASHCLLSSVSLEHSAELHYVIGIYYCIVSCSPPSGLEFPDYRGEAYYCECPLDQILRDKREFRNYHYQ